MKRPAFLQDLRKVAAGMCVCSLSVLAAEPLMLLDNSMEALGVPIHSSQPRWMRGHGFVQPEVKSSFPLDIYGGFLPVFIRLLSFPSQSKNKALPCQALTDVTS